MCTKVPFQLYTEDFAVSQELEAYRKRLRNSNRHLVYDDVMFDFMVEQGYAAKSQDFIEMRDYINKVKFDEITVGYDELIPQFKAFEADNPTYRGWMKSYRQAKQWLFDKIKSKLRFPLKRMQMETFDYRQVGNTFRGSSHPGYEFAIFNVRTKADLFSNDTFLRFWHSRREEVEKQHHVGLPLIPATRIQPKGIFSEGKESVKHRLVAMVSTSQLIYEAMYSKPMTQALKASSMYAGLSDNTLRNIITARGSRRYATSIDYSSFDASVPNWVLHDVFDVIFELFEPSSRNHTFEKVIRNSFINKVYDGGPTGRIYSQRGIPSGSNFTQIVGTMANLLIMATYLFSIGEEKFDLLAMGDDNLIHTYEPLDTKAMAAYIAYNFDMKVNPDETTQHEPGEPPSFLSRQWLEIGPTRPVEEIVFKLLLTERFRPYGRENLGPEVVIRSYELVYPGNKHKWLNVRAYREDFRKTASLPLEAFAKLGLFGASGLAEFMAQHSRCCIY